MSKYRVVILDDRFGSYAEEESVLSAIDASIDVCHFKNEEDAIQGLRDADAVLVNLFTLTATIIQGMERCKIISRYGVGYDNVDVEASGSHAYLTTAWKTSRTTHWLCLSGASGELDSKIRE